MFNASSIAISKRTLIAETRRVFSNTSAALGRRAPPHVDLQVGCAVPGAPVPALLARIRDSRYPFHLAVAENQPDVTNKTA